MRGTSYDFEVRHLRYFLAAADHGSFRRASIALSVGESAISRRVRDLEDKLGASLFQRTSGGISLTFAGERFLRRARSALQQINDGAKDVAAIGRSELGHIKIGIFSSLASGFLFELLRAFDQQHAGVLIELMDGNPAEHAAAIRQLQLDIAFITGTTGWPDCEIEQFWSERVFAALPHKHPLAANEQIIWPDLVGEKFIVTDGAPGSEVHEYLLRRLADLGYHPDIERQLVGRDNLLAMVAVGRGLTLTSEATTGAQIPGVVYRPIADEVLPFSAIWSTRNDNPASRRFLSMARAMAASGRHTTPEPLTWSPSV